MPACSRGVNVACAGPRALAATGVASILTATVSAHPAADVVTPATVWRAWTFEPGVVLLLGAVALLYGTAVFRLRRAPGGAVALPSREIGWFAAGWLAAAVALVSPLDAAGGALFSAHMVQHELLMIVAAPLLAAGMPLTVMVWMAPSLLRRVPRLTRVSARLLTAVSAASVAWILHAAAIVVWHVPVLFDAAVHNDAVHALQHASFFGTALLFWWGLLRGRDHRAGYGIAVLSVFTTAVYTSIIGALLAIAPRVWYSAYAESPRPWGMLPLEDQQLGGLIMWVPGGIVYTLLGLGLFAAWLRESEHAADLGVRAPAVSSKAPALTLTVIVLAAGAMSACSGDSAKAAAAMTGGDPARGRVAVSVYGCATCHVIPGIREAQGMVGPPLTNIASRMYLAGRLPNTPSNMERWIQQPHAVDDQTAMPETGVTDADARNIAAYLYTLR